MKSESNLFVRQAPAKINLCLEVLGRRPDGYHDIQSLMCPIGLFDRITVRVAEEGIALRTNDPELPVDSRNLAFQAAALLMSKNSSVPGVSIELDKQIPSAAGLGGGSADAAIVLSLVNELSAGSCSSAELMKIGAALGSDVPFFFLNRPAWATGRGEELSPAIVSPPFWVVLVKPSFPISTAWVYSQWPVEKKKMGQPVPGAVDLLVQGPSILKNDLEEVVMPRHREIGLIKESLALAGAWGSLMSGSGPTVFGVFFEEGAALEARDSLQREYRSHGWFVDVAQALL